MKKLEIQWGVSLTPKDIETIIKDIFEKDGFEVTSVSFKVEDVMTGFMTNERVVKEFTGVEVKMKKVEKPAPSGPIPRDTPIPGGYI